MTGYFAYLQWFFIVILNCSCIEIPDFQLFLYWNSRFLIIILLKFPIFKLNKKFFCLNFLVLIVLLLKLLILNCNFWKKFLSYIKFEKRDFVFIFRILIIILLKLPIFICSYIKILDFQLLFWFLIKIFKFKIFEILYVVCFLTIWNF